MQGTERGQVGRPTVAHPCCPVQSANIVDHSVVDVILWAKRKSKLAPPEQAGLESGSDIRMKSVVCDVDQGAAATGTPAGACNAQCCKKT